MVWETCKILYKCLANLQTYSKKSQQIVNIKWQKELVYWKPFGTLKFEVAFLGNDCYIYYKDRKDKKKFHIMENQKLIKFVCRREKIVQNFKI